LSHYNLQNAKQDFRRWADAKKALQVFVTAAFSAEDLTTGRRERAPTHLYWKEEREKTLL